MFLYEIMFVKPSFMFNCSKNNFKSKQNCSYLKSINFIFFSFKLYLSYKLFKI